MSTVLNFGGGGAFLYHYYCCHLYEAMNRPILYVLPQETECKTKISKPDN